MGRARTKAEKYWALIKWKRRQFNRCVTRNKINQEPLPMTKVGDFIMVFAEGDSSMYGGPTSTPLWHCGCSGGADRKHTVIHKFLKVTKIRQSFASVIAMDDTVEFEIYQPSIIFNIGPLSPVDPKQDFSMLSPAQKKFIIEVFTSKPAKSV
jgi:hypothetical protein